MKATILVFSPSGNTAIIGERLQQKLEQKGVTVQKLNITANPQIFIEKDFVRFFRETVAEHDMLCIGGPVYAHHLQYHLHDLLRALPKPGNGWGSYAFPFVTYGGICSGIALEEAGELLRQSGRTVLAGMKVGAVHNMTRAFMEKPINHDLPGKDVDQVLEDAVEKILSVNTGSVLSNQLESLKYQPREVAHKANTVFIEKEWHATRYPKVTIDTKNCTHCGRCVKVCPVAHLGNDLSGNVVQNEASACIHCFNCVVACQVKAVSLQGNPEQARAFMANMMKNGNEFPNSAVYPINDHAVSNKK